MKKVDFIEINKGSHFEYHLPCGNGLLDDSLFYREFELEEENRSYMNLVLGELGIENQGTGENSLLYSILIKTLSSTGFIDIANFGDFKYLKEYAATIKLEKIEWKNSIDFTINDSKLCRQYGYQTPAEFLSEMNSSDRRLANRGFNLYRVEEENLELFINTFCPDVSSWTFFLNSDWNRLSEILQNSENRPLINQMLEISDCIVDIQIGGDEGYLDYVLIHSKRKLTEQILALEKSLTRFGEMFENIISDLSPFDESWKTHVFELSLIEIQKEAVDNAN